MRSTYTLKLKTKLIEWCQFTVHRGLRFLRFLAFFQTQQHQLFTLLELFRTFSRKTSWSRVLYNVFRQSVYHVSVSDRRNVVDSQRVEQSLALGDLASRVPVALVPSIVGVVVVAVAAAKLQVGPVDHRPVAVLASAAGKHHHGDQHDGVYDDDEHGFCALPDTV